MPYWSLRTWRTRLLRSLCFAVALIGLGLGIARGADAVAANTSLFRASLRETASNIGSAVSDGLYKVAADETGSF